MDHLLSVSQAARLVGVRRGTLQQHIQQGEISTFEGAIRVSELLKVYPDVDPERSAMVDRVQRIQEEALFKIGTDTPLDKDSLAGEVHRLRLELGRTREELDHYRNLASELKDHLYAMQEQCDRRQRMLLGTLINWLVRRIQQRV